MAAIHEEELENNLQFEFPEVIHTCGNCYGEGTVFIGGRDKPFHKTCGTCEGEGQLIEEMTLEEKVGFLTARLEGLMAELADAAASKAAP